MIKSRWFIVAVAFIVIIIAILFFRYKELAQGSKSIENYKKNPVSLSPRSIDTSSWTKYSNDGLGFSIKIPVEVYGTTEGGCFGGSSFRVPLKTLQDGDSVYIVPEYYYEIGDRGYCKKVEYSDDFIKKEAARTSQITGLPLTKLSFGWKITVKDISVEDIAKYVKDTFGSSCVVNQLLLGDDGNYRVNIKGTDWSVENGDGNCFFDFASRIIYSPLRNKIMSVVLGQECTFYSANPNDTPNYQCYDDAMVNSFIFH